MAPFPQQRKLVRSSHGSQTHGLRHFIDHMLLVHVLVPMYKIGKPTIFMTRSSPALAHDCSTCGKHMVLKFRSLTSSESLRKSTLISSEAFLTTKRVQSLIPRRVQLVTKFSLTLKLKFNDRDESELYRRD